MRLLALLLALVLALPHAADAQGFDLPGLSTDADRYQRELTRRSPAGTPPAARATAEARAAAAERAGNWAAAAQAWEERVAGGDPSAAQWLALGRAQLNRAPPLAERALQAGWLAYMQVPSGTPEIPALLLMADALARLDRPAMQLQALGAIVEREPENARWRILLADARRAAGLLVARINTEAESEPARACLQFTTPPARRTDWQPGDWVRADPPVPGLTVVREGDALCAVGLPWGTATRLILRPGLPGEDGLRLNREAVLRVAMPNRAPRIAFDAQRFLLPRGTAPRIGLATVNTGALTLRLVQVTERNLIPFGRNLWTVGEAIDSYSAEDVAATWGRTVWEGRVELPPIQPNRTQRAALPLPDALRDAGPGLFVLVVKSAEGDRGRAAALPVMVTDLGLTAWRGSGGLAVQVRGFAAARPRAGVRVRLLASSNDILAEAETGADGLVRFAAPLLRGTGATAPRALHAFAEGGDFVALDLDAAAFDLSDRGADGAAPPAALDAFLWLDRGIYRPGETVQAAGLLRDAAGAPVDVPVRLRLKRPNGTVFAEALPPREAGAAVLWPARLPQAAAAGVWTLEALVDPNEPPIGSVEFRVDAFVPERLEVNAGPAPGPLVPGQTLAVPVTARFLYGAPAAGLTGSAELRLVVQRSLEAQPGYLFGLADENYQPDLQTFEIAELDAAGAGTLDVALAKAPDTTRPLRGELSISIDEPGGRASRTSLPIAVRAAGRLIGIKPAFGDGAIDADAEAAFEVIATDGDGRAVPGRLRARLVRERPDWRVVTRGGLARYETVWRDEPVDSAELTTTADRPARFARTLGFGRYRLEVADTAGLAMASVRFRAGWAGGETPEVPDKVDVSADRRSYAPGETARLRISAPFAGPASVAIVTDRVLSLREIEVAAGGTEMEVPVDAGWGPGAHVAVTVFRPGDAGQEGPRRALGLTWVQLDPASRRIGVAFDLPDTITPRRRLEVPIRLSDAGGEAMLTLAAVDEGILRLTRFATPDPVTHYMGRRRLGLDIRDDYGRLISPAEGEVAALRQGGDAFSLGSVEPPQRVVALFSGPVRVGADGRATVTLDIPDFAGELRLMAVAWSTEAGSARVGSASRPLTVRDPLIAEALLPRFLAPGDEARLPVLLHNIGLPAGEVSVTLTATGALALAGPATLTQRLDAGARATPSTTLRGVGTGEGVLTLAVRGPNGFAAERESRITVRSSRPLTTEVIVAEMAAGAERALALPSERFLPGSWVASARFGGPTRYDAAGLLRQLAAYPMACLEQSASQLLAFAAQPADGAAGDAAAARLQAAAERVLALQRFDGGFGLWSASGEEEHWLGPYAIEALLRARIAGAAIPEAALEAALKRLVEAVEEEDADTPENRAALAYRLHALALAGRTRLGAARRLFEDLDALPTPLARAQLGAVFARAGDRVRAEAAFTAALAAGARQPWAYDYGNATRDALAIALLLKESGVLPARLAELQARLPGPELTPMLANTQEAGWAAAAAAALGRDGRPARVALGGRAEAPAPVVTVALTGPTTARNLGDGTLWSSVSITGIPTQPLPASRAGMRIARRFLNLDGTALNLDQLRTGTVFVLLVEGRAETREAHRALLQQGLPAGWEIVGRLPAGEVPGLSFLGTLTETVATPALDDRLAAAFDLGADAPEFRLAARIRVVTPGRFELPGAQVEDMYRPAVYARQNTARIRVLGPDEPAPPPSPPVAAPAPAPLRPTPPAR